MARQFGRFAEPCRGLNVLNFDINDGDESHDSLHEFTTSHLSPFGESGH